MKITPYLYSEDIAELEAIAKKAFGATTDANIDEWFSFAEMKTAIKNQRGICLQAISEDGEVLGFIYAQPESPINGVEGLEKWVIVIIAVSPDSASQGIGAALLNEIEKLASDKGAIKMFVYTNKGDERVVGFYQKNGYSDAGWVRDYQYGKENSAVFLLKHLKPML